METAWHVTDWIHAANDPQAWSGAFINDRLGVPSCVLGVECDVRAHVDPVGSPGQSAACCLRHDPFPEGYRGSVTPLSRLVRDVAAWAAAAGVSGARRVVIKLDVKHKEAVPLLPSASDFGPAGVVQVWFNADFVPRSAVMTPGAPPHPLPFESEDYAIGVILPILMAKQLASHLSVGWLGAPRDGKLSRDDVERLAAFARRALTEASGLRTACRSFTIPVQYSTVMPHVADVPLDIVGMRTHECDLLAWLIGLLESELGAIGESTSGRSTSRVFATFWRGREELLGPADQIVSSTLFPGSTMDLG